MILIIDLSKKPKLVLKNKKILDSLEWEGLYQLSETLLLNIDQFLKKNKIELKDLKEIKVIESKDSIVSNRIAQAIALGLKIKK